MDQYKGEEKSQDSTVKCVPNDYYTELRKYCAFLRDTHAYKAFINYSRNVSSDPVMNLVLFVASIAVSIPLLLFIIFASINVVFGFAGFLIIQIAILAVSASVLGGVLFCILTILIIFGTCIFCVYSIAQYIREFLKLCGAR
ncbi:hypothetical protein KM043_016796 [Ampulex compressa]|nr:hypothetical protein KM043_016796 [Ampulex compressa]